MKRTKFLGKTTRTRWDERGKSLLNSRISSYHVVKLIKPNIPCTFILCGRPKIPMNNAYI